MNKLILFFFLFLTFSCKAQYSVKELETTFTPKEIRDLELITEFFRDAMCLGMDADFKKCYEFVPHEYLEASGEPFWTRINYEDQKKLYEKISKSTFDDIWTIRTGRNYELDIDFYSLSTNLDGKYFKYLNELGKSNLRIKIYAARLLASGDYHSGDFRYVNILNDSKYLDLNDPNIHLILSIHYLSLSDHHNRSKIPIEKKD